MKTSDEFLEELKEFLLNNKNDFIETKNSPAISFICDMAINKIEQFQAEQKAKNEKT